MNVGVLGSGTVGQTHGAKLADVGNSVVLGSREPGKLAAWADKAGRSASAGTLPEAAAYGELVADATVGMASVSAPRTAGAAMVSVRVVG